MTIFHCQGCGNTIYFENIFCLKCNRTVGFLPDLKQLAALEPGGQGRYHPVNQPHRSYRPCGNETTHGICNWLIEASDENAFCQACRLNETIPDLTISRNKERWQKIEQAKRRVLFSLQRMGLPDGQTPPAGKYPLRFRFLGDAQGAPPPLTGHENGVITINIAEADDDERERRRVQLMEPYRTLIGHLRHELAHYYWDLLILGTPRQSQFRALFGDESRDYQAALQAHYQQAGAPAQWADNYITAYAASHPWEDWAETFAHYLHLRATLETSVSFGLQLAPAQAGRTASAPMTPAEAASSFESLLSQWLPLTCALNEVNRSMGLPDLYPFILSSSAIAKLKFVHEVIAEAAAASVAPSEPFSEPAPTPAPQPASTFNSIPHENEHQQTQAIRSGV